MLEVKEIIRKFPGLIKKHYSFRVYFETGGQYLIHFTFVTEVLGKKHVEIITDNICYAGLLA